MTPRQAGGRIAAKVKWLNKRETRMGMPELHEADVAWPAIGRELQARLSYVGLEICQTGRPSMPALEALGAWVAIAMQALDHAETLDVTTGDGTEQLAA